VRGPGWPRRASSTGSTTTRRRACRPIGSKAGTTWRRLDEAARSRVTDVASAKALLLEQPSIIKRPVVEWDGGTLSVGFDPADWQLRLR
jgi:arsenate reductase-like glutaredoxin family protein